MESRVFPPVDGSVTLPETLDFHVQHNTYAPAYVFAGENADSDPTQISFLEFGRAADRVAHHIRPARRGADSEVVAVVALSDTLLYQAITMGILRAGLIPYPMSPRNTGAAIAKLMKDTSCHRLIATRETLRPLIDDIRAELASTSYTLDIEEAPPLDQIFPLLGRETLEDPFLPYPKSQARPPLDAVLMYLHSSGSTGWPKTIPQTFRTMVHWASLPPVMDNRRPGLKMGGMALPPFHTLGIIVQLLCSLYAMQPVGLYPPIARTPSQLPMAPTPGNILEHLTRSGCNGLMIIPALLQIWGQDKAAVSILAGLEYVGFSGGSMPSRLGDAMVDAGVYITPVYGATEFGAPSRFFRREGDEAEWAYVEFSGEAGNVRWEPQGDGTFELQLLSSAKHQVSVENLSNVRGYATSDLWVPHPTKPYLWKIVGRKDDVIVHTSGEKTVPAPMEDILMSSPLIMGTVMFGRERNQAGVLIELKPAYAIDPTNEDDLVAARNALWPIVEEANKVAPAFSRIFKEMILIASPDKPLPRAGKGTVMRKAALEVYAQEIDDIYAEVDDAAESDSAVLPVSWDMDGVIEWLKEQIEDVQSSDPEDTPYSVSDDLFAQGMDSLSATILRRRIVGAMSVASSSASHSDHDSEAKTLKAAQLITQTTIYAHPSIEKLAAFVAGVVQDPERFVAVASRADSVDAMVGKYTVGLGESATHKAGSSSGSVVVDKGNMVVLLTGSTGNLGAQILESLLRDVRVQRVYTLDRPASVSLNQRQAERFEDKSLDVTLLSSSKLVPLECDAAQRNLGVTQEVYDELRSSVTTIIHNAWKLDFNQSLSSFEPNVRATRNLVDLAWSSAHAAALKFVFTSSISSAASWDQSLGAYPEEIVLDSRYAVGNGYGESKYVAERILAQSGLNATSLRIGQITGGAPNGAWATSDWVPMMVKSSVRLGALPTAAGVTSWIPLHAVSQAILDVVWADESVQQAALNLVHPRPVQWNAVMSSINDALVNEGVLSSPLRAVSFEEWVGLVEKAAGCTEQKTLRDIPAIKLLDFFRSRAAADSQCTGREMGGLATFTTEKMASISYTVDKLQPLDNQDALMWVRYWKSSGFF